MTVIERTASEQILPPIAKWSALVDDFRTFLGLDISFDSFSVVPVGTGARRNRHILK
jgi:hypothetical protein